MPDLPVSITHSGDYAVAALGSEETHLAVDIEKIEEGRMQNIMRVAFSDREIESLHGKSDSELYLNWTVKEAFLKYIKKGFAEGLKKVEIFNGSVLHNGSPVDHIGIHSEIFKGQYAFTLIFSKKP
jgi:4'-phosphopantetheinyl transferase